MQLTSINITIHQKLNLMGGIREVDGPWRKWVSEVSEVREGIR